MFELFLDTADIKEIRSINKIGIIDGVTTNPSLIRKCERSYISVLEEICDEISGPVSAEVVSVELDSMLEEAHKLSSIAKNIVIKLPLTTNGISACKQLRLLGKKVNVTLCFSSLQAVIAARVGASYISPFIGRIDDNGWNGIDLIKQIQFIYKQISADTKILAASVRHSSHFLSLVSLGIDSITAPPSVIYGLFKNNLTDKGLDQFIEDWKQTQQTL